MTWKISIELDCNIIQAERVVDRLMDWAHADRFSWVAALRLPYVGDWSPAVMLEPHHLDDAELAEAVQHLRRLKFDTAAEAVQAARRNLNPTDPPNVTRLVTEQRLAARRRVDTHQARGGRIL